MKPILKYLLLFVAVALISGVTAVSITSIKGSAYIDVQAPTSSGRVVYLKPLNKGLVGLNNVQNLTPAQMPISTAALAKMRIQTDTINWLINLYQSQSALISAQNREIQQLKTAKANVWDSTTVYNILNRHDNDITALKGGTTAQPVDLSQVNTSIAGLRTDVDALKAKPDLKASVDSVKSDFNTMKFKLFNQPDQTISIGSFKFTFESQKW